MFPPAAQDLRVTPAKPEQKSRVEWTFHTALFVI